MAFRAVGTQCKHKQKAKQAKAHAPGSAAAEGAVLGGVAGVRTERRRAAAGAGRPRARVG